MATKICSGCKQEKGIDEFYKFEASRDGLQPCCKVCSQERNAACYQIHREAYREQCRQRAAKMRLQVFQHYSSEIPKCAWCGEDDLVVLCIDHIDGGGNKQRKMNGSGNQFYYWLRKEGYPKGLQVLCHNCNVRKQRLEFEYASKYVL